MWPRASMRCFVVTAIDQPDGTPRGYGFLALMIVTALFNIYALLFVAFDIEVIFIYLWALVFRDVLLGGLVSMLIFVGILLLGLGYAWRKGVLSWK